MMDPPPDKNWDGSGIADGGFHYTSGTRQRSSSPSRNYPPQHKSEEEEQEPREPTSPIRPVLRGSGSYPSMIRARTANRNKITKRNSESSVILTGGGSSMARPTVGGAPLDSKKRRHHHPHHKKKSVYSRVTRRKSLENLGLVVRNRCGTAKLQWPSEKKESDIFDLLPEGCLQVRQLRMRTPKWTDDASESFCGAGLHADRYGRKKASSYPGRNDVPDLPIHSKGSDHESFHASPPKTDWKSKRNISVIVRIRPKQTRELDDKSIVFRTDPRTVVFDPKEKTKDFYFQGVKQSTRNDFGRKRPNRNVFFHYDKVYGPDSTNRHIFNETLQDLTDHLIEGFNSTVFAYGATGSGKTYTMIGSNSNPGLIVLMVESLYKRIEELAGDYDCDVACSYLEVYNETIKDLLKPEKELYIREDGKKGIIIPELTFYKPRGPNELLRLLRNGNRARTQHATDLNAESSRSHAVFEVKLCLKRKKKDDGGDSSLNEDEYVPNSEDDGVNKVEVIQSKLVMVDLAGSERGAAATASSGNPGAFFMDAGARQREGSSINKSLLALANCISALADGKCHIPYRNSKLTRLLKDALSGNCTTVMIANISPSNLSSEDTYNTLKYADRAKNIVGPGTKQRNVFLEDLLMEDTSKIQMAELQAKVIQLSELLEVEKLKNEKISRQQSEEHIRLHSSHSMGKNHDGMSRGNMSQFGGGDADGLHYTQKTAEIEEEDELENVVYQDNNSNIEILPPTNNAVTEDELPPEIQEYMKLIKERARVYSEYVQFASDSRLSEWTQSCKKLKANMADLLGRLPVSNEHYVTFCKLKNEVNNMSMANVDNPGEKLPLGSPSQHKKYAIKLKNLTEKLELLRLECVAKNLLLLPDGGYMADSLTIPHLDQEKSQSTVSPPAVAISLEEFLQFKRLLGEQEGNDKMEQFYHQFSNQINTQLITSGMTLMHALKLFKRLESLKTSVDGEHIARNIQQEFKELSDFVYGPGSSELNPVDSNYPNCLQPQGRPPTTSMSNLGRRSNLILEDLQRLKKTVEQPLLIQLTTLFGPEQFDDDEDDDDEREDDLGEKGGNENSDHELNTSNSKQTYSNPDTADNSNKRIKSLSAAGDNIYETIGPLPSFGIVQATPMNKDVSPSNNNDADEGDCEEDFQADYHPHHHHHHHYPPSNNLFTADNNFDNPAYTPAQPETEVTADESSSNETLPPPQLPELPPPYETPQPETGFIQRSHSLLVTPQPTRRKRRTWTVGSSNAYENDGRTMITTMSASQLSLSHHQHATSAISNKPTGNTYNGKEVTTRKSKSHLRTAQSPVMGKPTREPQSQHNSDWYTISGTSTETTLSTATATTTSSSASTSNENVVKRESKANNPNQIQTSGAGQQRKQPVGNTKRLAGHQQTQPISGMGQLGKSGQEAQDELLSSGEKILNPKYTYRLESPSKVMQAFSAAHSAQDSNLAGESSGEDEDTDEDESSIEISAASSIINRGRISADRKSQMSNASQKRQNMKVYKL